MAKIISIDNTNSVEIGIINFEVKEEGWVTVQIALEKQQQTIVKDIGAYLQLNEIEHMIDSIKLLLNDKSSEFILDAIEPNLSLRITINEETQYEVMCSHVKDIGSSYPNENNSVHFTTTKELIDSFIQRLDEEMIRLNRI